MLSPSQGYFFVQKAIEAIIIILTIFKIIKVEDQRKMISSEKFLRVCRASDSSKNYSLVEFRSGLSLHYEAPAQSLQRI